MITANGTAAHEKDARHEASVLDVIRNRFREARQSRITGDLVFRISMHKGGPTKIFTEVGVTYKILEEV